jgi:hypothetical protein
VQGGNVTDEIMLQEQLRARVPYGMVKEIHTLVADNSYMYDNFSHFVRCALMREIRKHDRVKR